MTLAPYAPRRHRSLGLWEGAKAYLIEAERLASADLITAAQQHCARHLPQAMAATQHHGAAFAVLHAGADANWLLLDWWTDGDILSQTLWRADRDETRFLPVPGPALACVWELTVLAHERDAWVRHMLRADPDPAGWRADVLPAGSY